MLTYATREGGNTPPAPSRSVAAGDLRAARWVETRIHGSIGTLGISIARQGASSYRQSTTSTERRIELPCQEEPPVLCASSASSTGACGRSGTAAAGGGIEQLEAPGLARAGGGWGGEGGGSGRRRRSEAAGVEMRRCGPCGGETAREEQRKGGRHSHGGTLQLPQRRGGWWGVSSLGLRFSWKKAHALS
jgi:hypothetical protein